jgi:hypothetical protein
LPESYKPRALRLATAAESVATVTPAARLADAEPIAPPEPAVYSPERFHDAAASEESAPPPLVDLRKLEAELGRRRLDEIADVVRTLTYGEMMELAETMWSVRPDDSALTERNLPAVLYRWSTSRQS